jgi:hypothetical protein
MARKTPLKKVPKTKSSRQSLKRAKRDSLALRTSVALSRATRFFVDLHKRIQDFVLNEFSSYSNDIDLNAPLPKPVNKVSVMEILVDDFEKEIDKDSSWGVDPNKLQLTGKDVYNAAQKHKVSYVVQFVYQRAHDALRV